MSNVVVSYIKLYMYLWGDGMHVLYDSWLDWCHVSLKKYLLMHVHALL